MKEFKFRAWNTMTGHMRDLQRMNFKNGQLLYDGSNMPTSKDNTSNHIVMQYTGLKDMNYKEIYVGDIVKINTHKYSIKFEIGSFMLVRCSDETDMYEQFENCWCDDVYPLAQFHWESNAEEDVLANCEVIGNIYENPKLMEGLK